MNKELKSKDVEMICAYIYNNFETFSGNCGVFAYGLACVLGPDKCKIGIAQNTHYREDGHYHVAVKYKGRYYDGHGLIDRDVLKSWAEDDGLWGDGVKHSTFLEICPADEEGLVDYIKRGTDWWMEPEIFEYEIRKSLNMDITIGLYTKVMEFRKDCDHTNLRAGNGLVCDLCGIDEDELLALTA